MYDDPIKRTATFLGASASGMRSGLPRELLERAYALSPPPDPERSRRIVGDVVMRQGGTYVGPGQPVATVPTPQQLPFFVPANGDPAPASAPAPSQRTYGSPTEAIPYTPETAGMVQSLPELSVEAERYVEPEPVTYTPRTAPLPSWNLPEMRQDPRTRPMPQFDRFAGNLPDMPEYRGNEYDMFQERAQMERDMQDSFSAPPPIPENRRTAYYGSPTAREMPRFEPMMQKPDIPSAFTADQWQEYGSYIQWLMRKGLMPNNWDVGHPSPAPSYIK